MGKKKNGEQQSLISKVEMSYINGKSDMSWWSGEINDNVYWSFGMDVWARGVDCGVVGRKSMEFWDDLKSDENEWHFCEGSVWEKDWEYWCQGETDSKINQ